MTTCHFTYPSIRLVYCPHPKLSKLPTDLPLLVFIHGLGGSAAQFAPLLTCLSNAASCLLLDLPGCGRSDLKPTDEAAYTLISFAEIVAAAIDRFIRPQQKVVLVGHSLGCSIGALLASSESPVTHLLVEKNVIAGFIAICPRADSITPHQRKQIRRLKYLPIALFDAFRAFDQRGGLESKSVSRFVGDEADLDTKKLQLRFNAQSKSATVLKFLTALGRDDSGWPSEAVWKGINVPLFLVAAENDKVVSPKNIDSILAWLVSAAEDQPRNYASEAKDHSPPAKSNVTVSRTEEGVQEAESRHKSDWKTHSGPTGTIPAVTGDVDLAATLLTSDSDMTATPVILPHGGSSTTIVDIDHKTTHHTHTIKTTIFQAPASHGVVYSTATVRPLSSLIQGFLASYVDPRLSPGWQLTHLSIAGKWDVKNLKKWETVAPISGVIGDTFRAMKTMREVDEVHCPGAFVRNHGCRAPNGDFRPDGVGVVIDISHETPVYDPRGLEAGGVHYFKFPTVSKLPPSPDEVAGFIGLVDRLKAEDENIRNGAKLGVHCHYGYNRTGTMLCAYLIERLGWRVQDAVEEFRRQRPPGIKHEYFVDELFLRYSVKVERRGTIIG